MSLLREVVQVCRVRTSPIGYEPIEDVEAAVTPDVAIRIAGTIPQAEDGQIAISFHYVAETRRVFFAIGANGQTDLMAYQLLPPPGAAEEEIKAMALAMNVRTQWKLKTS